MSRYRVESGDTLERIAAKVYGDATRSGEIARANQIKTLVPGDMLAIPPDNRIVPQVSSNGLVLVLNSLEIPTESIRFFESIETIADGWTAVIAWTPGALPELDKIIRFYSYADAFIFLDGELLGTGRLYGTTTGLTNRNDAALECWSLTADFVDSALKPPYEESKVTLKQRTETLLAPFALSLTFDLAKDGIFDRVTASEEQTAGAHLLDLANQRGALVSSTAEGGLKISIPLETGVPVATIAEGVEGYTGFGASSDGRARFSDYRVIGETPFDEPNTAVANDPAVPIPRFRTKKLGETTSGEIQRAADWEKTKFLANTLSLPIIARGFKNDNGQRWKKGDYVTLISPTLFIPDGFLMLIKSVEFLQKSAGETSTLTLVPPSVYSGGELIEPWA